MSVLEGIRVIDASRILAGPHCGQMLADNGAEVIKVESPEGDQNRAWPPVADGAGTNFLSVNRGKQAITLNLKHAKGQEILQRLVAGADIFIQNFLPPVTARLRVDYETLNAINPDLIYVSVSGYGAKGPMRDHPGFGATSAAFSGIMDLTGEPDGPPLNPGLPFSDMSTGIAAYAGAVTALLARTLGMARGQRVDVSLMETNVALLGPSALNWLVAGKVPHREGAFNRRLAPYGPHRCQDGDIMISAPNDGAWRKLCHAIDAVDLEQDSRFLTNALRSANGAALREALEGVLRKAPIKYWFDRIARAGVACAPINAVDQVLSDEQVLANEMVVHAPKRDGGTMPLLGLPIKLSVTPGRPGRAPPHLGEDTDSVLQRLLGFDSNALAALRGDGVI
jgi:crotonobetainyl-CoA:carnitine CoA-transferase CaiB-like acyl-CoA transferase